MKVATKLIFDFCLHISSSYLYLVLEVHATVLWFTVSYFVFIFELFRASLYLLNDHLFRERAELFRALYLLNDHIFRERAADRFKQFSLLHGQEHQIKALRKQNLYIGYKMSALINTKKWNTQANTKDSLLSV